MAWPPIFSRGRDEGARVLHTDVRFHFTHPQFTVFITQVTQGCGGDSGHWGVDVGSWGVDFGPWGVDLGP